MPLPDKLCVGKDVLLVFSPTNTTAQWQGEMPRLEYTVSRITSENRWAGQQLEVFGISFWMAPEWLIPILRK